MNRRDETNASAASSSGSPGTKLRGILLPFPTPFDAAGEFDAPALAENIEFWNGTGIDGYVALGSTGERVHLDEGERLFVVETARASVPRSLAFIVGVGEQSVRATVREAVRMADAEADALLVLTPHFYKGALTQDALTAFFLDVADAAPVPVLLYNIPQNTGVALAPATVARLAEHANIIGLKDSSGDVVNLVETLRLTHERDDFHVMTGHAAVFYAALCAGASGGILAAACAAPRLCSGIYDAVAAGDHERALALQRRLDPLARAVTTRFGIGGLKAALDLLGLRGGPVRPPLRAPVDDVRREIARSLEEAGVVDSGAHESETVGSL